MTRLAEGKKVIEFVSIIGETSENVYFVFHARILLDDLTLGEHLN